MFGPDQESSPASVSCFLATNVQSIYLKQCYKYYDWLLWNPHYRNNLHNHSSLNQTAPESIMTLPVAHVTGIGNWWMGYIHARVYV